MNILVPNLGSTSLKYQLVEMPSGGVLAYGRIERVSDGAQALSRIDLAGHSMDAVAFKAVHGGPRYRGAFLIDGGVLEALEEFLPAAPAHNRIYLAGIRAFQKEFPELPLVAAFETGFHVTIPEHAARYGVPSEWREGFGIRKYGFHGASHQYVSERVPDLLGRASKSVRLVSCHLGGSSSICAIDRGESVDTTMGFSPQSGLENATRHGDLDVFAVLYMMARRGWTVEDVIEQLSRTAGLAGLSGIPGGDVRDIEAAAAEGSGEAALALEVFTYQVRKTIGAYAAVLGGLDAVVFTGGIGENSATLREACCRGLEFLGIHLDREANESGTGDRLVSDRGSSVSVAAIATNEESIVARRAYQLLESASRRAATRL
jgi:acetate kinase